MKILQKSRIIKVKSKYIFILFAIVFTLLVFIYKQVKNIKGNIDIGKIVVTHINVGPNVPLTLSQKNDTPKEKIAYAVSITQCPSDSQLDGAAILRHSIHKVSYPNHITSRYAYEMIAIIHLSAMQCIEPFRQLGYLIITHDTPIDITKVRGAYLREHVTKSGCCGEREYIKLYAYSLLNYPIVVHLDLDSILLQPFDELFDAMFDPTIKLPFYHTMYKYNRHQQPNVINAYFTRDYPMANYGKRHVNIQGGLFIIKPDIHALKEFQSLILEGNFTPSKGWEGKYGGYYGSQQIQGLMVYYYDGKHPNTSVELNRCIYNQMVDDPYVKVEDDGELKMKCRDLTEHVPCNDCRLAKIDLIKSAHFTFCQKPWSCPKIQLSLCRKLHKKWFQIRREWENDGKVFFTGNRSIFSKKMGNYDVSYEPTTFQGYCKNIGKDGYVPIF